MNINTEAYMVEIIKMNENTWRLEDGFVRFFLLVGSEKAVMIDSGVDCPDAADIAKTLTDKPVILLNTHGDGDHTSGTGGFNEIHIHPLDYVNCRLHDKYPDTALAEVNDGDVIELGGRPLEIVHIPGHTKGSIAVLDVNDRTVYSGDSVQNGHIYMFGMHRDTDSFEGSLERLIEMKDKYDRICASHGECVLPCGYAEKIKAAWSEVHLGNAEYEAIDLHGNRVRSYTLETCGFYLAE